MVHVITNVIILMARTLQEGVRILHGTFFPHLVVANAL